MATAFELEMMETSKEQKELLEKIANPVIKPRLSFFERRKKGVSELLANGKDSALFDGLKKKYKALIETETTNLHKNLTILADEGEYQTGFCQMQPDRSTEEMVYYFDGEEVDRREMIESEKAQPELTEAEGLADFPLGWRRIIGWGIISIGAGAGHRQIA